MRTVCFTGVAVALVTGAIALAACDDSDPVVTVTNTQLDGAPIDTLGDDAGDDDSATPYMGPTQGGIIVTPTPDSGSMFIPPPTDGDGAAEKVDDTCCNLVFTFNPGLYAEYDAGADAGDAGRFEAYPPPTAVYVVGSAPPLNKGTMLPMTLAGGVWTATACVPETEYLEYRFYTGMEPDDPNQADGGPTDPVYLCDPNQPQTTDGTGACFNTFGPVTSCGSVDASTGLISNDP